MLGDLMARVVGQSLAAPPIIVDGDERVPDALLRCLFKIEPGLLADVLAPVEFDLALPRLYRGAENPLEQAAVEFAVVGVELAGNRDREHGVVLRMRR